MKSSFFKEAGKPFLVLVCICLVSALLLAVTNGVTAPIIDKNVREKQMGSLYEVMPDAAGFEEISLSDAPETVRSVYRETGGKGYVLLLATTSPYSNGDMGITVAIDRDGVITGITITSYYETKDIGTKTYPQTYIGKDSSLSGVELVTGATYSSTAFKNAVADAFSALTKAE